MFCLGKDVLFKSSSVGCGTAQLLMTSLAIGQISLDVRTHNECFSVHYLCKLETKHPKHGLIVVSAKFYKLSHIIISHHIKNLTAIKVNATFVGHDPATLTKSNCQSTVA